jgi:site-specific recombinase XerC
MGCQRKLRACRFSTWATINTLPNVQEVPGHSNVSTTLNIYSHLLPSVRADIADAMDRMLGG